MKKFNSVLWGLVLIALGVILGVNALGIAKIDIFFSGWWTLFIIIPCAISLFTDDDKWGDLIGLIVGVCLLLGCQGVVAFNMLWKLLVPAVLVVIGLSLIFKDTLKGQVTREIKKLRGKSGMKEYWATFGGQNLNFDGQEFTGCSLEAVFGSIKCDLRNAKVKEDVLVKACAVFGGITIHAPEDVNVQVLSNSMFGGTTNRHAKKAVDESKKTIFVDATSVFGGVEVR